MVPVDKGSREKSCRQLPHQLSGASSCICSHACTSATSGRGCREQQQGRAAGSVNQPTTRSNTALRKML